MASCDTGPCNNNSSSSSQGLTIMSDAGRCPIPYSEHSNVQKLPHQQGATHPVSGSGQRVQLAVFKTGAQQPHIVKVVMPKIVNSKATSVNVTDCQPGTSGQSNIFKLENNIQSQTLKHIAGKSYSAACGAPAILSKLEDGIKGITKDNLGICTIALPSKTLTKSQTAQILSMAKGPHKKLMAAGNKISIDNMAQKILVSNLVQASQAKIAAPHNFAKPAPVLPLKHIDVEGVGIRGSGLEAMTIIIRKPETLEQSSLPANPSTSSQDSSSVTPVTSPQKLLHGNREDSDQPSKSRNEPQNHDQHGHGGTTSKTANRVVIATDKNMRMEELAVKVALQLTGSIEKSRRACNERLELDLTKLQPGDIQTCIKEDGSHIIHIGPPGDSRKLVEVQRKSNGQVLLDEKLLMPSQSAQLARQYERETQKKTTSKQAPLTVKFNFQTPKERLRKRLATEIQRTKADTSMSVTETKKIKAEP